MIYTVTLNPSIDYVVRLESLVTGITNRTTSEEYYFGGKGINVSCVLAELDLESTAFGFVAGFTGEAIEKGISFSFPSIRSHLALLVLRRDIFSLKRLIKSSSLNNVFNIFKFIKIIGYYFDEFFFCVCFY